MGKAHTVCEDYARDGVIPYTADRVFAIVSDGCSSSQDTDFGSRFLTMAALPVLSTWDGVDPEGLLHPTIERAREAALNLGLPTGGLDATLLVAHETKNHMINVVAAGDGWVLAQRWDGILESWEISMQGAPGYYSYRLDYKRFHDYLTLGYGERTVTHRVNGEIQSVIKTLMAVPTERAYEPRELAFMKVFSPETYRMVMVLSDGVQSFRNSETKQDIPLAEVLPHVVDIRNPTGAFLRRSHNWFLTKTCPKLGWQHTDDFGAAAIIVDPPVEKEEEPS
jgi:hypothetical protein